MNENPTGEQVQKEIASLRSKAVYPESMEPALGSNMGRGRLVENVLFDT